jgi:hypothetical protein
MDLLGGNDMSQDKNVNEIKYKIALAFLNKLIDWGKITHEEFDIVDRYAAEKYKPALKSI